LGSRLRLTVGNSHSFSGILAQGCRCFDLPDYRGDAT